MALRRSFSRLALVGAAVLVLAAMVVRLQAEERRAATAASEEKNAVKKAVCVLSPTKGSDVKGVITFTEKDGGVQVSGEVNGLTPGDHGFHIHEFGDVSKDDGMGTGGHFNPEGKKHGNVHDAEHHAGDMGNIKADSSGKATVNVMVPGMKLNGPESIVGHGLIVHAKPDDFSQPTGNAGGRVAQGVIGVAK